MLLSLCEIRVRYRKKVYQTNQNMALLLQNVVIISVVLFCFTIIALCAALFLEILWSHAELLEE